MVTLPARSAATQGAPAGSTDGSGDAGTPPKNPSTSVAVTFTESAAALPQADIRTAIARELERMPTDSEPVSGELNVSIEGPHLVARFRSTHGYTERILPLPDDATQIPLMLALLAGNLARDQRPPAPVEPPPASLAPDPFVMPVRDKLPPLRPKEPEGPAYRQHYVGLNLAQDLLIVGGKGACNLQGGQANESFVCFYPGTNEQFVHGTDPNSDTIDDTLTFATTRVLVSYDYSPWPQLSVGARAGFAFGSGPRADLLPVSLRGAPAASPFFPGHLEGRATFWLLPLTEPRWHAYLGLGGGVAQVEAGVRHSVVDCEVFAQSAAPPSDPTSEEALLQSCRQGQIPGLTPNTELDAWKLTGQAFVALHSGVMLTLSTHFAARFDLNVMYMFPATAFVFEPALGMAYTP